jgi:type I restriction enzyme R subunit
MNKMTEDTLVQQTASDYLQDKLGWEAVYTYNEETLGLYGTLGRKNDGEVVLTRYLKAALVKFNKDLPQQAYEDAVRQIVEYPATQSVLQINQDKYALFKDGVLVQFRDENGELIKRRLKVFDFEHPEENHFLAVRELWVKGALYRRRTDIMGFVNGIPLLFIELKNVHKNLQAAYEKNLSDYRDTVPHLFHHNAIIVLANGVEAKLGSYSSRYKHFLEWKRLEETEQGVVDMETLLKGICDKHNFMDMFENFIVFDDSTGKLVKILARNHQFLGVNRAIKSVIERKVRKGKLGIFWHTQGAGKSYSMVFFTRKIHRKLGGNFTFLVCTDRDDLDSQIYKTFAGCKLVDNDKDPCRAESGDHLQQMLGEHKAYVFTLIQKFNKKISDNDPYSHRDDLIVITDEAHRTQNGIFARNMRDALTEASFIGFTGTPLFKDDEVTRRIFGDYVSTYDFQRAVEDGATVPLYYDARGEKLGIATNEINERIAQKLDEIEIEDINVSQRLEKELKREYHLITAQKRLDQIAADFVRHYSTQWENGKAMLICIDKITCVRMYDLIDRYWQQRLIELEKALSKAQDDQDEIYRRRQIDWMKTTRMAVVVSEEQGEMEKFRKWDLDITVHRQLIKQGFETQDGKRLDIDMAFKKEEHPFRIAIVCAMWLTGFDVPSLATLYLDKPLKAHTLMQAIARANRVNEGKNNGLIVDYCGILKNLRIALATFAGHKGDNGGRTQPGVDPVKPADDELLGSLEEAIAMVRGLLETHNLRLEDVLEKTGFERNKSIADAKEIINRNDETRKRFEIMAREVFKKFKACINIKSASKYRDQYDAVNIIYNRLQIDREQADITDIIQQLHAVVDGAIDIKQYQTADPDHNLYDISKIDFERLRREFERCRNKNTTVANLKDAIEKRLDRMIQQNPLRTDFQEHYEKIVSEYNTEKDRATIEKTFEELMKLVQSLDYETRRVLREGLDEENLALFDLLVKPGLSKKDIERIKKVAKDLLEHLKADKLIIDNWREKEATRDSIRAEIHNCLYNDVTGLPESYTEDEISQKTEVIFTHIFRVYSTGNPEIYATT